MSANCFLCQQIASSVILNEVKDLHPHLLFRRRRHYIERCAKPEMNEMYAKMSVFV